MYMYPVCWLSYENTWNQGLCRIKPLPVTHVLVDTWMLTVKPVYKLLNVSDDLKWTTNTHVTVVTPFSVTFKAKLTISIIDWYGRVFAQFLLPVHPYFYPSIFVFTRPNDGWTGLYIKLCASWVYVCVCVFQGCMSFLCVCVCLSGLHVIPTG